MELTDWLLITEGRVTEGSEFGFDCYGDRAYSLSYWNGLHGEAETSTHVVYDRDTFDVFETDVYDGAKNKSYVWRDPSYAGLYNAEIAAKNVDYEPEWPEIELETVEDFTEKATAIMNGEEYDDCVSVPLNLDKHEMLALMLLAHERNITLNQLINAALREELDKKELAETEESSAWPFSAANEQTKHTTWTQDDDNFIGSWNTIKEFELVHREFHGGELSSIVSHTYDTPVFTYTVYWYEGDVSKLPDEIIRTTKHV
jgi:hypothetical protein